MNVLLLHNRVSLFCKLFFKTLKVCGVVCVCVEWRDGCTYFTVAAFYTLLKYVFLTFYSNLK